jgi:hypothetical protein
MSPTYPQSWPECLGDDPAETGPELDAGERNGSGSTVMPPVVMGCPV